MSFERDAAFERALIESARDDAQPVDVQRAWARFAGALAPAPATLGARPAWSWGVRWLLLAAIGGGGFGAGVLVRRHAARDGLAPGAAAVAPAGREPTPSPARPPEARSAPAAAAATSEGRPPRRRPRPAYPRLPGVAPPPTLADEVARIDTARTVTAMGDYDEAVHLIERYHRDFPAGLLAPDADVVALEAAAAKHDHAEVARRAALFLARYPDDPHAARVRYLASTAARRWP